MQKAFCGQPQVGEPINIYCNGIDYCARGIWAMLSGVQPPLPLLDQVHHGHLCEASEGSPRLRGLSQRALGGLVTDDKANGSVRINRYEQEVNRADMDTAAALAQALDVPLAYLFAEEDDQAEMLLAFAKLSKSARSKLLELAKQMAAEKAKK